MAPLDAFKANHSDIQVNILWFTSLVLSLVVALFGIFLKQWVRTHLKWTEVTPERKAVALRQYRYLNIEAWDLNTILTLLPIMLQASLILFLCGLLVFLWNINPTVAKVMTALIASCLFLVAIVTFLPLFIPACAYKSPLSELLVCLRSYIVHYAYPWYHRTLDAFSTVISSRSRRGSVPDDLESQLMGPGTRRDQNLRPVISASWQDIDQNAIVVSKPDRVSFEFDGLLHTLGTSQSEDLTLMVLTCLAVEARSNIHSISYSVWLTTVKHVLDPTDSLGDRIADSQMIRYRIRLLSKQVQRMLFYFCEMCFLPQEESYGMTAFEYSSHSPPESTQTIIAVLAGMDQVPGCTLEGLAELMVLAVENLSRVRSSEAQIEAIVQDFFALFKNIPATSIKIHQRTELISTSVVEYCDTLKKVGNPSQAELRLLDILLQLAICGETEELRRSSKLLDIAQMVQQSSQHHLEAGIIIRPSGQALVALARLYPERFPPRYARGIYQLVQEPFSYNGQIPAEDWKRILDEFEPLIDDDGWWFMHVF
jgi:hypothetical protein